MRLIHTDLNGDKHEVKEGYQFGHGPDTLEVTYCPKPHKSGSSGKVTCKVVESGLNLHECFTHVYDMEWIEREDRGYMPIQAIRNMVAEVRGYNVDHLSERALIENVRKITFADLDDHPDHYARTLHFWLRYNNAVGDDYQPTQGE